LADIATRIFMDKPPVENLPPRVTWTTEPLFESKSKHSVSPLFFLALLLAVMFVGVTALENREIAERRLVDPVKTNGTLISVSCTTRTRGGGKAGTFNKPVAVLTYQYSTSDLNASQYIFVTQHGFDTMDECKAFDPASSLVKTLWYEKAQPSKASLYEKEPYYWGYLYGLILSGIFLLWAIYDQRAIRHAKNVAQNKKQKKRRK
jgi:hypothetical protein